MKKKTQNGKINIVNLSNYVSPDIKVQKDKEWVTYGYHNEYFQFLLDRYKGSPTNNAIINGMSQMIYGKGLDATDANRFPNEYAQAVVLLRKECVRKLVYDLKLMGQCAIQIIYSKDRTKIAQVEHMPVETLAMEKCDEDGEVKAFYYHHDWAKIKKNEKPERIPAFGTSSEAIEILYVKPYVAGHYYFSPVDYQGGLQYAELEEEIANYHINNIMNGLAPSMLINFNNGIPNEEERELIERKIYEKYSGSSNAGRFILSFNEGSDTQSNIEAVQLSDAHNQYQFLSDESMRKIMVSHRIVSPMLLGIKDQSGLGNNADELKTASTLMDNTVIRPFQEMLLDAFDTILSYNNISLNLYFKTLQPLEFTEIDSELVDDETQEEETGVKMNSEHPVLLKINEIGEDEESILENYNLVHEAEVDYELEDTLDAIVVSLNKPKQDTLFDKIKNLAKVGKATPYRPSEQDGTSTKESEKGTEFLVRYMYTRAPGSVEGESREFCRLMMQANKVYTKENILNMNSLELNPGFGGSIGEGDTKVDKPYSIWLYKGGPRCQHRWTRKLYARKGGRSLGQAISTTQAIKRGFRPQANDRLVSIAPKNMEYAGYTKEYWDKMGFEK